MAFLKHLSRKQKDELKADQEWEPEADASNRMSRAYGSMSVSRSGRFKSKNRQRKSLNNVLDLENSGNPKDSPQSPKTSAAQHDVTMTSHAEKQTTDHRGSVTVTSSSNVAPQQTTTDYGHAKMTSPDVEWNSVVPRMAKGTAFSSKAKASGYSTAL